MSVCEKGRVTYSVLLQYTNFADASGRHCQWWRFSMLQTFALLGDKDHLRDVMDQVNNKETYEGHGPDSYGNWPLEETQFYHYTHCAKKIGIKFQWKKKKKTGKSKARNWHGWMAEFRGKPRETKSYKTGKKLTSTTTFVIHWPCLLLCQIMGWIYFNGPIFWIFCIKVNVTP